MEEALLIEDEDRRVRAVERKRDDDFMGELKKVSIIAMPMMVVSVSQYMLRVVSMSMAGHLGQISLSSAAIASSFANVTGFSLLFGMSGALETLCGQAYGARQYRKLRTYTYTSIISLILVCVPVSLLWTLMDKILIYTGQGPEISHKASEYVMWLVPSLFAFAILQSLVRYLQTQSMILPMVFFSVITLCLHVPLCWALVFKTEMGTNGAALAIGVSYWVNVILLGVYLKYSSALEKTRATFSKDIFRTIGEFFHYMLSLLVQCLEWWSYEIVLLLSGFLPDAKLETSVLTICLSISSLHSYIQYSFGAAASTRVSNELGAGNSQAAQMVVRAVMALGAAEVTVAGTILFCCRNVLGKAYSNDEQVVDYVARFAPFLCLSTVADSFQVVLSGITRGSGWQQIGAYINLGAFYVVAIPLALVLGFILDMGAKGFWIGLTAGPILQFIMFSLLTCLTDWQIQVIKARDRTLKEDVTDFN